MNEWGGPTDNKSWTSAELRFLGRKWEMSLLKSGSIWQMVNQSFTLESCAPHPSYTCKTHCQQPFKLTACICYCGCGSFFKMIAFLRVTVVIHCVCGCAVNQIDAPKYLYREIGAKVSTWRQRRHEPNILRRLWSLQFASFLCSLCTIVVNGFLLNVLIKLRSHSVTWPEGHPSCR